MKSRFALLAALALFAGSAVSADHTGFFAGAGIGGSDLAGDGFSGNDFAFKVFGGFDFNQYIALEGAYLSGGSPSEGNLAIDLNGWDVALLGKWPVNEQFDLLAKLGVVWWDAEADEFGDDSGEDLLFGFGVGYHFSDQLGFRGEWERMDIEDTDRADLWTVSLFWKF